MKLLAFLTTLTLLLALGESLVDKWTEQEILLKPNEELAAISIESDVNEYIFSVDPEIRNHYGRARYTITFFIDEMSCTNKFSYLMFATESEEISLVERTCQNITKGEAFSFKFNNGANLGAGKVRVRPLKSSWSKDENHAEIRAELKITRQIFLGDETPQMDIIIDPEIDYEIAALGDSKFCTQNSGFKCAVAMTVSNMNCWETDGSNLGLKYVITNDDGIFNETICSYYYSIKSLDSIKFELVGEEKKNSSARVTTNLEIIPKEKSTICPPEYFTCNPYDHRLNISCIPERWRCDGRENCPISGHSDEAWEECFYWSYTYGYSGWSLAWAVLAFLFMLTGIIFTIQAIKSVCRSSRRTIRTPAHSHSPAFPIKDTLPTYEEVTRP